MSASIADRIAAVRERVAAAARRAGRDPAGVTLVGVAKRKSADDVVSAVRAGLRDIAENYVQEAMVKIPEVNEKLRSEGISPPRWHFIGQLQRNKARHVVPLFDAVQTLDRESLGDALERRAAALDRRLEVLLQVDLSDETQKGGVAPEALADLWKATSRWPHLSAAGLMAIPAVTDDPDQRRRDFARLRRLGEQVAAGADASPPLHLSMGMSGDFEVAIEEGATIIRVGTALFGPRDR